MIGCKRIIALFFAFSVCIVASVAQDQNLSALSAGKLKNFGKNSVRMGDTYSAIEYYEAYLGQKPNDMEICFQLAELYRAARNYEKALESYKKVASSEDANKYPLANLYLANMLKVQKRYDEAYDTYRKFRKECGDNEDLADKKKLAQVQMESCLSAQRLLDSALVVWIIPVDTSINKASVEFSPMFINDSVFIYASLKSDTAVVSIIDEDATGKPTGPARQFYMGKRTGATWKNVGIWSEGDFNAAGVNTGNGAYSPDRQRFYFTRCDKIHKGKILCNIYQSQRKEGQWSAPEALPEIINLPKFTSTQPAVGTDSKTGREVLYFVSDREEGRGGLDIWYTMYDARKKAWNNPKNCGSAINTGGDEVTPFIDQMTRTLYFSSNGHGTIAEMDIFRALGENSKWLDAENVGYPINSPYDDFYYVASPNKEDGFFVSNRPTSSNKTHSTCCDDIYAFKYNEVVKVVTTGMTFAIVDDDIRDLFEDKFNTKLETNDKVADTSGMAPAEGTVVSLFMIDKKNMDLVYITSDTTDAKGKYYFPLEPEKEYALEFQNYGHFNKKIKVSTMGITQSDTIVNEPVGINLIPKQPLVVSNLYYDFNSADLSQAAKKSLEESILVVMTQAPEIVVEISSHTDSKGDDDYNKKLSQKRAESVVQYLIKKGIDPKRLYAKGYGEEKPIAKNENPDGSDNTAGREKNRRTEFKIIGSLEQYSEIIYEQ